METYRERVRWSLWFHAVLAVPWGLGLAFVVVMGLRSGPDAALIVPGAVFLVVFYVHWRLRYLEIEAGRDGIAFGFAGLRRRVPRERIVSCAVEAYSALRYMGWGYRFGMQARDRAYSLVGHRHGVRLVFDDEAGRRWSIFLSSADPEAIVKALET